MADGQRKSSRSVKLRQDPDFYYEEESWKFLLPIEASDKDLNKCSSSESVQSDDVFSDHGDYVPLNVASVWSELNKLPLIFDTVSSRRSVCDSDLRLDLGASQSSGNPNAECTVQPVEGEDFVNNPSRSSSVFRQNSCTRSDFLDLDDNFLSASSAVRTDTSEMGSDKELGGAGSNKCTCKDGNSCSVCAPPTPTTSDTYSAMMEALKKIDKLTTEVKTIKQVVIQNQQRLDTLEGVITNSSSENEQKSKDDLGEKKVVKDKSKSKQHRVDEEKDRQLRILRDKLKEVGKRDSNSDASEESEAGSELDLRALKKKMTKKQKKACDGRVSFQLKKAGAIFPGEDGSTSGSSDSSGTDSGSSSSRRRKNKVKSGAKIKKRPVLQTELWPHTIANEDDDEDCTSENISLSKFLSCFTFIMVSCGKAEKAGRSVLLHAICSVFECLPWTDARAFHNLIMVKLEQRRINWRTDFSVLAEQFLDKKVRQNLRSKSTASGSGSFQKSGGKSFGKGFSSSSSRQRYSSNFSSSNRSKSLYALLCKQWNDGNCTYGDRCKKWHICWTCAENGKLGEQHKASSHDNTFRGKQQQHQHQQS